MLVLTRGKNEQIEIDGGRIKVIVVNITHDGKVKLGIEAPLNVPVHRSEVVRKIEKQNSQEWIEHPLLGFSLERRRGYYRYYYIDDDGGEVYVVYKIKSDDDPAWPRITETTVVSVNGRDPEPHERLALEVTWESSLKRGAEHMISQMLAAETEAKS